MKIQQLFDELKTVSENEEDVFTNSGMVNWSDKMQYGFFPLGMGILTERLKTEENIKATEVEIEEAGVMVLGNDFGTIRYVNSYVKSHGKKIGETDSNTINNFL